MENIINFISNIDNSTYNKIRHSKSDAECRRYLKEQLTKQLSIHVVVPKGTLVCGNCETKLKARYHTSKGIFCIKCKDLTN